jgi:hypothetical protein
MRDLTGEAEAVVAAERASVAAEGWGARLLDLMALSRACSIATLIAHFAPQPSLNSSPS